MSAVAGASVLVTGAAGFIGSHLVARLVGLGSKVTCTSRRLATVGPSSVGWLQVNLEDPEQAAAAFDQSRPDFVVHLSSLADGRRDANLIAPILRAELLAAVNVMTAAVGRPVRRIVLPGSLEEPLAGDIPGSPYGAAKAATRSYARMFHRLYRLPVVIGRIFMAFGPGQAEWKIIPSVIAALRGGRRPIVLSPDRAVDWIYVSDVVDGLIRLCETEAIEGETIDIGTGVLTSIGAVVDALCRLDGSMRTADYRADSGRVLERVCCADTELTWRMIAWRPAVTLEDGLKRTMAAAGNKAD